MFKIKNMYELILVFILFTLSMFFIGGINISMVAFDLLVLVINVGITAGFVYLIDKKTDYKQWEHRLSPRLIFLILLTIPTAIMDMWAFIQSQQLDPSGSIGFPNSFYLIGATILITYLDKRRVKNINKDKLFV